jgi:excinuclease ABC subunit C
VDGIGDATAQALLRKFKSVKNIQKASLEELQAVVGKARGKVLFEYFKAKESQPDTR